MTRSYFIILASLLSIIIFLSYVIVDRAPQFEPEREVVTAPLLADIQKGDYPIVELELQQKTHDVQRMAMPDAVRSIYISSWVAGTPTLRDTLVSFVESSEINSVIIDIKDSTGVISFDIDHPIVNKYHSAPVRIRDIESFIQELHEKDIYVVGRLTAFQDPALAKKYPELALKRIDNGETWKDRKGLAFIDPKKEEAWEYLVAIAQESHKIGFDEINFDYIRYPSDGNISNINYGLDVDEERSDVMKKLYQYLDENLRNEDIIISADVFGLTTTATNDIGIGQILEDILPYFDAVAPMVYPSHYSSGFFGFDNPNAHPYGVVYAAMNSAYSRAEFIGEDPQKLRPWIQDFNLGLPYGDKEVRDQIKAVYDVGLDSYMVWDSRNRYTKEAYYNNIN